LARRASDLDTQALAPAVGAGSDGGDTIAAIATPAGTGGLGVVRVSGSAAIPLVATLVGRAPEALADRALVHGVARDRDGTRLDEVLVVAMRAPRSYTGEDVAEVHGHGGQVNMGVLLRAVIAAGARVAEPGEFTRRAFENGKLDLTRAQAVVDVIEAGSERALRVAQAQLAGELAACVGSLRERVVGLLCEVEAQVDFPEEDLDFLAPRTLAEVAVALGDEVARLAATFGLGRALRDGISVAVVGPVNAGKSSLFNRLLGQERAVVTAEPGTTRDFVEARTVWNGLPIMLIDTAGERSAGEAATSDAERRGIELSRRRVAAVDVCIIVCEASSVGADAAAWGVAAREPAASARAVRVLSKVDLGGAGAPGWLATSARTGQGLDELRARVIAAAVGQPGDGSDSVVVTCERQRGLLARAGAALAAAAVGAGRRQPPEILAAELRVAAEALAEMVGERVGEAVLDALFARFCIGK
jgi:tRNA modification GTPase